MYIYSIGRAITKLFFERNVAHVFLTYIMRNMIIYVQTSYSPFQFFGQITLVLCPVMFGSQRHKVVSRRAIGYTSKR